MNSKRVLITGCSSGFGYDLVGSYLRSGWSVVATMRDLNQRQKIFEEYRSKFPDRLELAELDVTSDTDRRKIVSLFENRSWTLDCLVNNAGFGLFGALEDITEEQMKSQFEVNFFGVLLLTQQFLPLLRKAKGRIIVISSVVGYVGMPLSGFYTASKFALEGAFESLFYELKAVDVSVTLIQPGRFRTNFSSNMVYGQDSANPLSPYFKQTQLFKSYRSQRQTLKGISSGEVIKRVIQASEISNPPFRVRCGWDAKFAYWIKGLLPLRLWMSLIYWGFRSFKP